MDDRPLVRPLSEPQKPDRASENVSGPLTALQLQEALEGARDWGELETVLDDVNRAYHAGEITLKDAEILARRAGERSQQLPQKVSDRTEP